MAPVLGSKRDGTPLADTGRSLLFTVLGEFALPAGGSAWTQTLTAALELLGVQDKAARQAIARLRIRGWLTSTRVGRQTRWTLTEHATEMLTEGATRIYGLGREQKDWTGRWLVLLASVPERDRHLRYRLGLELSWAGYGSLKQGTWISPWPESETVAVPILERLGVTAVTFDARLGQLGSGPALVEEAWDLAALRAEYQRFLDDTEPLIDTESNGADTAAELAVLVHQWRRFPFLDPDLPAELLPADWPGPAAVDRFSQLREILRPAAEVWWQEMEASFTPGSSPGSTTSKSSRSG